METTLCSITGTVTRPFQGIPHVSVTAEINMDACREVVSELKPRMDSVGYNSLMIKACAVTLQKFPLLCVTNFISPHDINISFAVSSPDALHMPVIRRCQDLSVAGIGMEAGRLADRCRSGQITPDEMAGGSFSVSNLGMIGVDWFTALIVPGQTGILAVGTVKERPVVRGGQLAVASTVRVTLTCDHCVVDSAYAASFLSELQAVLEKPVKLVMVCPS